jgi:hypothetical protein
MKKKPPIGKRGRASSTPVSVQSKVRLRPSLPPLPVSLYPPPLCNTLLHVPSMLIRVWGNPQGRSPELCDPSRAQLVCVMTLGVVRLRRHPHTLVVYMFRTPPAQASNPCLRKTYPAFTRCVYMM